MANQTVQACCPASHGANYIVAEALGENLSTAMRGSTDETPNGQVQFNPSPRTWQITNRPRIATMNATGHRAAFGTSAICRLAIYGDHDRVVAMMDCLHAQLGGDQIRKPKSGSHGADSPLKPGQLNPKHHRD
ncbi:transposase IS204/IS1001/IS1096/IS1165 family domain protein [Brucella lupini]|uniref:Transposase IS204/IS1001/IS1096/IS1165 family domain protein n=1 Tax=Brucella lupini TaxID=255457 RepID=A0A256GG67_9HYPH|nr:transposase IS204/IS1001/IS1096/IS1165 family domain protein [Brucella lupini]